MIENELKMWFAVRHDLDMPPGKLAAQVGHGISGIFYKGFFDPFLKDKIIKYMELSQTKIVLSAKNENKLFSIIDDITNDDSVPIIRRPDFFLVKDEGRTVFGVPTHTILALGPCLFDDLPKSVKRLRLYK